jgi:energy-coupling factor transporter ATP-binding protein EcfA2
MALEELIVAWSKERPAWQQGVMCRVASGEAITDDDYERLVQDIVESKEYASPQFGLQHLSQTMPEDLPVCILEIAKPEHVNALESNAPLTFEPLGLNVVYGDNGSGKSGYARLLKRITRARHQEEVLTDVFRDTSLAKPTAALAVRIGTSTVSIDWPEASRPELQRILFYDAACGGAYTASESNFPYRPSALFVMDGLIEACVAIRTRIDARLADNGARAIPLPAVPEQVKDTAAGRFLTTISGKSSVEALDALIATFDGAAETIEQLKDQEASLRSTDTNKARQRHIRHSEKLAALRSHFETLGAALGISALTALQESKGEMKALEEAAALIACSFESEPLPGVGSPSWKALWEAAQRFSKEHAYAGQHFPFVADQCRCVLCQQVLDAQGQNRFVRFDEFVRNDTQVQLQSAERTYDQQVKVLRDLIVIPEVVSSNLQDLETASGEVVSEVRALLSRYEAARKQVLETLSNGGEIHQLNIDPGLTIARLATESDAATAAADELRSPEGIQKQLVALIERRDGLELLGRLRRRDRQ